jgi:hypothetical protein
MSSGNDSTISYGDFMTYVLVVCCTKMLFIQSLQKGTATPCRPFSHADFLNVTENVGCYGEGSENTGRPKTVHVSGYYRKDGTYVRGHYRCTPRRH